MYVVLRERIVFVAYHIKRNLDLITLPHCNENQIKSETYLLRQLP